jgi:hypothetical protein
MIMKRPLKFAMFGVLGVLFLFALGWVVMSLWNWLLPPLFGAHAITYWQALGVLLLCKILFGGFRGHAGGRHGPRGRMRERWAQMTPEERERFREGMRRRCGFDAGEPKPAS